MIYIFYDSSKAHQIERDENYNKKNNKNNNRHENNKNREKNVKRKNNMYFNNNDNNIQNYNFPINYSPYPILFNPFNPNNFPYPSFGPSNFTSFQNYNNNSYINYSQNNTSLENTQESGSTSHISTSEDKNNHYYDNFGDNYYDSLQKGIKDISQIYNNNKRNRPKISLLCNYYCNLDRSSEEEIYMNDEIERLSKNLKKILKYENENKIDNSNNDINVNNIKHND